MIAWAAVNEQHELAVEAMLAGDTQSALAAFTRVNEILERAINGAESANDNDRAADGDSGAAEGRGCIS